MPSSTGIVVGSALFRTRNSKFPVSSSRPISVGCFVIIPASPPFYHGPETLDELIEQFVDKIVGVLGYEPERKWRPEVLEGQD